MVWNPGNMDRIFLNVGDNNITLHIKVIAHTRAQIPSLGANEIYALPTDHTRSLVSFNNLKGVIY